MSDIIEPGFYADVPDPTYRAWPYPSQSLVSLFRDDSLCEMDVKHYLETGKEQSEAMRFGDMVEAAVDGREVAPEVQQLPAGIKRRSGATWVVLRDENPGITYLPPSEYKKHGDAKAKAIEVAAAVKADKYAMSLVRGEKQVSFVWDATFTNAGGLKVVHRVKGRLDYLDIERGIIADLKTTSYGGPRRLGYWARDHAWDIQAAMYTDAMASLLGKPMKFYFVVVRTSKPYPVSIYNGHNSTEMAGYLLGEGRFDYQQYLEQLAECKRTGVWRSYRHPSNVDEPILDLQWPQRPLTF